MRRLVFLGLVLALVLTVGGVAYWLSIFGYRQSADSRKPIADSRNRPPPPAADPPWFADVTDEVGLNFVHDPGPVDDRYFMPQIVGSGCALFDCDGDGLLDIYLLNNGGPNGRPNALYRQVPGGTFRDVSRSSGLDFAGYCMGAAVGDVDNDGLPDLVVTEYGRLRLFLNQGGGRFVPADSNPTIPSLQKGGPGGVAEAGLDNSLWGTSACFFDYDRDGWLDLVVVNYVAYDPGWPCTSPGGARDYCHPSVFPGTVAKLYRNVTGQSSDPRRVRFEDTTVASGLARLPGPSLGVTCADFDGDGWPDIFVANDAQPNRLWINQKDGTFKEEGVERGLAHDAVGRSLANMGVALGDVHGDGRFDIFVTHLPEETNTLWRQTRRGLFLDCTAMSGLLRSHWRGTGFGTMFADFNQDGLLDLAVANGRVVRARGSGSSGAAFWDAYAERNQLFAGASLGKFRDISPDNPALCGTPNVARGLAVGDIDGDGAPDLLVTCIGGRARLFRNVAPGRGHWLLVRAVDPALKRDAYGAEVTVETGGRRWVAWINPGQSYLCSNDPRAHFGLGSVASVDAVRVLWPDGALERFPGGPADRTLLLRKGEGTAVAQAPASSWKTSTP